MIDRTSDPSAATGDRRQFLLMAVRTFVHEIRGLAGLHRIALMGSLTTDKLTPKDADVLVTIDPGLDLTDLARAARRLKGAAQARNLGADIFLTIWAGSANIANVIRALRAERRVVDSIPISTMTCRL